MAKDLRSAELDAEHVELLPDRTLVTAFLAVTHPTAADVVAVPPGGTTPPSCGDIPWWAPKPPGCQ